MTNLFLLFLFITNSLTLYALKRLIKLYNIAFVELEDLEKEIEWVSLEVRALQ